MVYNKSVKDFTNEKHTYTYQSKTQAPIFKRIFFS